MYDDNNCRGCPIRGQREVSLTTKKDKQCLWKVIGGIIFSSEKEQNEPIFVINELCFLYFPKLGFV